MQVLVIGDHPVFRQGLASVRRQWPAVSSGLQASDGELALGLVIGANPTSNHLVAATWVKTAVARGSRIMMCDPRRTDLSRHAWRTLQFKPDTDVALPNAMIHTVIDKGLTGPVFLRDRASSFDTLKANVAGNRPELMAPVCGIPAEEIREVARAIASAKSAMVLWGMGLRQHVHGTDNARCLSALVAVTGQIGKPGSGLHPLRRQDNVQGASDAGLIPMMLPNDQRVDDPSVQAWFEEFWQTRLDPRPGLTMVEILHKAHVPESDTQKMPRHVHPGRKPGDERPRPEPRPAPVYPACSIGWCRTCS